MKNNIKEKRKKIASSSLQSLYIFKYIYISMDFLKIAQFSCSSLIIYKY